MSLLSDEEIYQKIGKIVAKFDIFECYECAQTVMQWLQENRIKAKVLRLKTRYQDEDYILSDRLLCQGVSDSITINGKHYGVEVRGKVFDNLSSQGMSREDWLNDFHCPSEEFILNEVDF